MRIFEVDNKKGVVFAFLRGNPFHYGHYNLTKVIKQEAINRGYDWYIFLSSKQEPEKNPLTYEQKIYWIKKIFPSLEGHIIENPTIKNPLQAATFLYNEGYRNAVFVAGEDDMPLYSKMIYSGNKHGEEHSDLLKQGKAFFFDNLDTVISPRLTSATSIRKTVTDNNPVEFAKALLGPTNYSKTNKNLIKDIETNMFNQIKQGMSAEYKPVKKNIKENITNDITTIKWCFISNNFYTLFETISRLQQYNSLSTTSIQKIKYQLDIHKESIIKAILLKIVGDVTYHINMSHIRYAIPIMKNKLGINWPELDVIEKSLTADKLTENRNLNNATEQIQLSKVKKDGYLIQYIKNPSQEVQLAAVKLDRYAIRFIKNPSPDVQLAAVKQFGDVLRFIKNPSYEVQLAAINQHVPAIIYIKNPSVNALNSCKDSIIKYILTVMKKRQDIESSNPIFSKLNGTNWPELSIIKKSLDVEQNRLTEETVNNYNYGGWIDGKNKKIYYISTHNHIELARKLGAIGLNPYTWMYKNNYVRFVTENSPVDSLSLEGNLSDIKSTFKMWWPRARKSKFLYVELENYKSITYNIADNPQDYNKVQKDFGT
jgi:hypothetical protein